MPSSFDIGLAPESWSGAMRTSFRGTAPRVCASLPSSCRRVSRARARKASKGRRSSSHGGSSTDSRPSIGSARPDRSHGGGGDVSPFVTLSIQSTFSLVAFALIALWHVAPRLNARSREDALVPLLWLQVFRYAPLALYAPGQV